MAVVSGVYLKVCKHRMTGVQPCTRALTVLMTRWSSPDLGCRSNVTTASHWRALGRRRCRRCETLHGRREEPGRVSEASAGAIWRV